MSQKRDMGQPLLLLVWLGLPMNIPTLHSVVDEYIVFVAGRAGGALQAAKEEDGRAQRHQEGEGICGDREPLKQAIHTQ
jgi:hypothetical protein